MILGTGHQPKPPCAGALDVRATEVFVVLVDEHALAGRVPIDALVRRLGWSRSTIHARLVELRDAGLIAWTPGMAGTLRPLFGPVGVAAPVTLDG